MTKICHGCGATLSDDSNFCPKCGLAYEELDVPVVPQSPISIADAIEAGRSEYKSLRLEKTASPGYTCSNCKAVLSPGSKSCAKCGLSFDEPVPLQRQADPTPLNKSVFYTEPAFTILMLLFCSPIGLILMWIYQKWNLTAKCAVTAAVAAVLIIAVATSSSPTTPAINLPPAHVKAAVPLTPEQKHQAALLAKVRAKDAAAAAARQKSIDAAAAKNAALQAAAAQRQQAEQNKQEHAKEVRQAEWAATHIQRNGLTLDLKSVSWFSDGEGSDYITGKITNDSGTDLNYVEVTYKLTDAQGSQVGVAMDNTNDLSAGATWKFKCYVADENATHCQLDDLTDTPL